MGISRLDIRHQAQIKVASERRWDIATERKKATKKKKKKRRKTRKGIPAVMQAGRKAPTHTSLPDLLDLLDLLRVAVGPFPKVLELNQVAS